MSSFDDVLSKYDYSFPKELIAQKPAHPRDSARLLVFDRATKERTFATFTDIGKFLPKNAVLVLNETKVIPARLELTRETGGKVQVLFLEESHGYIRVLSPKKLRVGEYLKLHGSDGFMVKKFDQKEWLLEANFAFSKLQEKLQHFGTMPLPPYIKHSPLSASALKREYQTVFAREAGSIAAPTASLHFTKGLLTRLQKKGIRIVKVTLHVHLGTFAPLTEEQWKTGRLHTEEYHIGAAAKKILEDAKKNHRPLIAVGTTVARTLESSFDAHGHITRPKGSTDLFIRPHYDASGQVREGYEWKAVDGLITNFHVPKSSLLMLVSAFAGHENIRSLYEEAIAKRMRLFSFGDGMLIL